MTYAWAPATSPKAAGTTSSRSAFSARTDVASDPSPASGTLTSITPASAWTVTRIGSCVSPVARARVLKSATAAASSAPRTLSAFTTTLAGLGPPGNARVIRW